MRRAFALLALLLAPLCALAQTLSLTFEDGLDPRTQPQAAEWNQAVLQALQQVHLQAMLFPTGKVVDSAQGLALVRAWGEAGHAIGNHTYAHRNFNSPRVSLPDFSADVLAADALLRDMPGFRPRLRFPYLHEGESADKRDGLRDWLQLHGYERAPVSIDTSDAYYNQRFVAWRQQHAHADATRWRHAYLEHLWGRAQYYDGLARRLLGRHVPHVMRLHLNAINAAFLPQVIEMFQSRGWTFVSPLQAYEDPLYQHPVDTLPAGDGVLWALARRDHLAGLRHPPEDAAYEKPKLDKLGL